MTTAVRPQIACAARRDYLPHTATMLCSLLMNSGPADVHLLIGGDVREDETAALEAMVAERGGSLAVHRLDPVASGIAHLRSFDALPTSHWYRVLLPEILGLERVLYLDGDLIVLDRLDELFQIDLGSDLLAAVTNPFPDNSSAALLCEALGIEPAQYFNSGVMVLDLAGLRRANAPRRVVEFAEANADLLVLPEQDAMNALMAERRLPLPPRWNAMHGVRRHAWSRELFGAAAVAEAIERPAIVHFEGSGPNKPWHPEAAAADRRLYESYRRHTPWPDPGQRLPAE